MNRLFIPILLTAFAFLTACGGAKKPGDQPTTNNNTMSQNNNNDYADYWKIIDSLDQKGLPRSAEEKVQELYELVKAEQNAPQMVKCLLYQSRYTAELNEEGLIKSIVNLEEEMAAAEFPMKAVLQSLLAELYFRYMDANQWQLQNRTPVKDFEVADIATWTVEDLIQRSRNLYLASLENKESQQINIESYGAILQPGTNTEGLRPTLYDFLAQRAIEVWQNERGYLTEPAFKFNLDQPEALGSIDDFINYKFTSRDQQSPKLYIVQLFQELLRFHRTDRDPLALMEVELQRLRYAHRHSVLNNKDALYEASLQRHQKEYQGQAIGGLANYYLADYYYNQGSNYVPTSQEEYKWEIKKAKELCDETIAGHPDSYGADKCQELLSRILLKEVDLELEMVNLPNKPILASISYKNVVDLNFRVAELTRDQMQSLNQMDEGEVHNFLTKLDPIKTWSVQLSDDGDYQQHRTEVAVDGLPFGRYVVLASPRKDFKRMQGNLIYAFIQVSNLAYWHRMQTNGRTNFIVVDRQNGAPLSGVKATFMGNRYNSKRRRGETFVLGSAVSDAQGLIETNFTDRNNFQLKLEKGDDELWLNDGFSNRIYKRQRRVSVNTSFFLDRAIYRPGQTIYFKGILIENSNEDLPKIVPNEKVTIELYDVNHQKVSELQLKTNEYGSFSGSFVAPANGLLGQMSIRNGRSRHYFRVEEYKRPKFEVVFDPVEGSFRLNEEVSVKGNAKALAGNVISDAKVQYRVVREVRYPYLPWYFYRWGYPSSPSMEIVNGTTTTDASGNFTIDFKAIPDLSIDPEKKPQFNYAVYADVTDLNGETRSGETRVSVGYVAMQAGFDIGGEVNIDSLKTLKIYTRNLAGQDIPASGTLSIQKLQQPQQFYIERYWNVPDKPLLSKEDFAERFPEYPYAQENRPEQWATESEVLKTDFNTGEKRSFDLQNLDLRPGTYAFALKANDPYGTPVVLRRIVVIYDLYTNVSPTNTAIFQPSANLVFEPGEQSTTYLFANRNPQNVYYNLIFGEEQIEGEWLQVAGKTLQKYAIKEEHRGNLYYQYTAVRNNRFYSKNGTIVVPWTNKELKFEYATFRDKLYPGQDERWEIKISGAKKDRVAAEMLAGLYDASLDQLVPHAWNLSLYPTRYPFNPWGGYGFGSIGSGQTNYNWNQLHRARTRTYPYLNWFGFNIYAGYGGGFKRKNLRGEGAPPMSAPAGEAEISMLTDSAVQDEEVTIRGSRADESGIMDDLEAGNVQMKDQSKPSTGPQIRRNLKETVFFFPDLKTDAEGNVIISFKMNEALTRWKFLGLAHSKDLRVGLTQREIVTQKDLMVQPNPPRFFREGDEIEFTAKVSNLTENTLNGNATLELFDALSMQPIDQLLSNDQATIRFSAPAGQSDRLAWRLKVPKGGLSGITHRVVAKAGNFSDGEEDTAPVVTNRMLVTETKPLPLRAGENKTFVFSGLKDKAAASNTLTHHRMSLEFTTNPVWYAVQSLPYLMEYPYECTEQIFSRYYANTLASAIANSDDRIRRVFDRWKELDVLESNLSKNQELKTALLEETPWVLQAQSEAQQKKNIGLLFDLNKMANEQAKALNTMVERQLSNGGFSWFPGGRDSWYITQYIVEGMGHLNHLEVNGASTGDVDRVRNMARNAVLYCDQRMLDYYNGLKKKKLNLSNDHLSSIIVHYLYMRSFYSMDEVPMDKEVNKAFDYFVGQARKYWLQKGIYGQGMIALALARLTGDKTVPTDIVNSLRERALRHEELGMYWKSGRGYFWDQRPIETQALLIEVFEEVAKDAASVDEMRLWLLKNKQTNHWETTKATASAIYALLLRGINWLAEDQPVMIAWAGEEMRSTEMPDAEPGTGYFKYSLDASALEATQQNAQQSGQDALSTLANIKVDNPNQHAAWGALYWQYFEDLDQIKTFEETPLTLKKQLFKEVPSPTGPQLKPLSEQSSLEPGDKVKVRIELRVDRPMEYVHLKDMRASGFEPLNVLSGYRWQGGLGYYESTRDLATNFFIGYLPTGTHVFEYPLRVVHKGDFSNGITTIQCMYAPEYSSHSEGIRVQVK